MRSERRPGRRRGLWERAARALFRLYPGSYRNRHGLPRETLTEEILEAETDPARRGALARRIALDAMRTLPGVWAQVLYDGLRPAGGAGPALEAARQDLRHSMRSFLRRPTVPLVAVASIALGIGFNAALFSAVNALLLRPTPGIAEPERVVEIGRTNDGNGFDSFSYADMLSLREGVEPLEHVSAWEVLPLSYGGGGAGERVIGMAVSAGYFEALGALPSMGRSFLPEEDVLGGPAVAVVSDRFWRTRLEADPGVLGRSILVNRVPVTVVGVTAEGFAGHFPLVDTDVWLPFARLDFVEPQTDPRRYDSRRFISHQVIAKLADGATLEQANAAVAAVMSSLAEAYPDSNRGRGALVAPLGPVPGAGANGAVKAFLGLLMGLVALILLVAAANVAGMLLARAAVREKEVAIRLAIGSGRARLARQLLMEALVLALVGAAAGMLLASWATSLITTIEGPGLAITVDLGPDGTVFAFAFALALLTGLFIGIVPALQSSRLDLLSALKLGMGGTQGSRARRAFVTVQVGVCAVLLAVGALLARSLAQAGRMSGGFEPEGIHMTSLDLGLDGYSPDQVASVQEELRAALAGQPGVDAVALAIDLPLDLSENAAPIWPDSWAEEVERGMGADFNSVSPGYFAALRIPLIRGRDFDETDRSGPPVAVVSEALARRAWGDEDPVGRTLRWSRADDTPRTVVGVVGEVKNQWAGESEDGMVYLPLTQRPTAAAYVLARGTGVDGELLRSALLQVDARLTLSQPQTLEAITAVSLLPSRLAAGVSGLLGGLALLLSSLGVYGVVAQAVAQRRREIGVRLALGARRPDVIRMAVVDGFKLALPGLLVGAAAAIGAAQLLRSLLFGISPTDPLTLGAVTAALTAAIGLASWIPGRRAAAVDPVEALGSE